MNLKCLTTFSVYSLIEDMRSKIKKIERAVINTLQLATRICYYNMFSLEQTIFIVQCYFRNGERLENGEWSYSTPRVFEKFQQKFPEIQDTYQQLALIILFFHI
jgi:hypothetical protein